MRLRNVVTTGRFCGLETIEECVLNFELHMIQLFPHSQAEEECKELAKDIKAWEAGTLIIDMDEIDVQVEKDLKEYEKYCREHPPTDSTDQELEFLR